MTTPNPARRRWRVVLAWLALAALGQGLFGGLAHLHEHGDGHEEAAHGLLVTSTGEAAGCAQRHLHAVRDRHDGSCTACALVHGKSFRAEPLVLATRLLSVEPAPGAAAPAGDRRALAPLPARGPPAA